jgi:hypothetical protein
MDCAIHSATAEECRVRRVYNRVNLPICDVAAEDLDSLVGIFHDH